MRGWNSRVPLLCGIAVLLLLAGAAPAVSAWYMSNVSVSPSGDLKSGDEVSVTYNIVMDSAFEVGDELMMSTELGTTSGTGKPTWAHTVYVDGIENAGTTEAGRTIYVAGWDISYDHADQTILAVTLKGTVQPVTSTTNLTILTVKELNSGGSTISSTVNTISRTIISTAEVSSGLSAAQSSLNQLRTDIDDKSAIGVDVSEAEAKYSSASSALSSAQGASSSDYSTSLKNIASAETLITEAETLLNKAWAEKVISDAQVPMTKVNTLVNYFKVNLSLSSDARVSSLVSSEETAEQYLSSANDYLSQSNYDQARIKANQAFEKANQTYTDALALNATVSGSVTGSGGNVLSGISGGITKGIGSSWKFILIGVVIVLVVVGILYWRSRSRWDELG
ncbi:MAG: hypothetical protein ABFC24_05735 [Methanoregulaceae archaeon]